MLSRVAESLFWIGRYVERAENTARMLDVNYYATLEGSGLVTQQWAPLLVISGAEERFRQHHARADGRSVPAWLAFDRRNPSSISSCLTQARENARGLRDRVPSEMWECINAAYYALCFSSEGVLDSDGLHTFCVGVRDASQLFHGISAATHPRDEGWAFLRAGQKLERGDNLLRLLGVRYRRSSEEVVADALDNHRWMAVLKSASAYEAYRKRHFTRLEPRRIAAYLLLDPDFPRSVRYCAQALHGGLSTIARAHSGPAGELEREAAWLVARLCHARIEDILDLDSPSLDTLLADFARIGRLVQERYFPAQL
ncbi:MAG: alpha-E domain-containing protein [Deinococcus sp.]